MGITVLFVWDVKMEVMRYVSAVNFDFSAVSVVRFGIHVLYPYFRHKVGICQTLKSSIRTRFFFGTISQSAVRNLTPKHSSANAKAA